MPILFHATVLSSKEDSASFMSIQKRMLPGKARSTYSPSSAWERSLRPCAARMTVLSGRSHARGGWAAWNLTRGLRPPPACHALRLRFLRRVPCRSACAVFSQVGVSCWGWCRFVGLVVDSITTNHATRPSSRRRSMMLMPNSVLIRLSRYQSM